MTNSSELYACLYAREFPAQALLRLRPEMRKRACAVMEGEPPMQTVCSLNLQAQKIGASHSMTRVEMDTFPAIALLPRSIEEEAAARGALLESAGTFSPRVENRSDGNAFLCAIDIAGTEKLLGPPMTLARTLLERVRELGIEAVVAIGSNFHTAICMAKSMSQQTPVAFIPAGDQGKALAPLSLAVLDLQEEHAVTFSSWGICTLGMLAGLPENDLIARLGQEGKRLRQLARGELPHLFLPLEPAFTLEERMELDSPVEQLESLLFVMGAMLEQLIVRATARALALASVTATLTLEGCASHARTVRPALPSNDRQLWIKLLHLDLEVHPPQAAILSLTLHAEPGSTGKVQLGLFSPQVPEAMQLDVTLARIRVIVGEGCAGRAVLRDTHRPDGFGMEPFAIPTTHPWKITQAQSRAGMRQLRPPENTTVTWRDGKPEAFTFREKRFAVEHAYGPWLTGGEWWNPTLWRLEQWDLVSRALDGAILCCCLAHDVVLGCWQVAALYD